MPAAAVAAPVVTAAIPAITAAIPAATAAIPAASALIPAVASAVPAIAGAAEAIGTTAPMIANVIGSAAPAIAETAGAVAPSVAGLAQQIGTTGPMISEVLGSSTAITEAAATVPNVAPSVGAGPWQPWNAAAQFGNQLPTVQAPLLSEVAGSITPSATPAISSTAAPTLTPAQVMGQFTGPQMTPTGFGAAPSFAEPLAPFTGSGFGTTPLGATGTGSTAPVSSATKAGGLSDFQMSMLKSAGQGLKGLGDQGGQDRQPAPGPVQFGDTSPALDPYVSGHRSAQDEYAASVMQAYLQGGGYG